MDMAVTCNSVFAGLLGWLVVLLIGVARCFLEEEEGEKEMMGKEQEEHCITVLDTTLCLIK